MNQLLKLMKSKVHDEWSENEVCILMEYCKNEDCVEFFVTIKRDE